MSNSETAVPRDEEGYLIEPDDWSTALAQTLATEEDVSLTEDHWAILNFVRDYFAEHLITPDIRHVARHLADRDGGDKKAGKALIFELFPYGYVKRRVLVASC